MNGRLHIAVLLIIPVLGIPAVRAAPAPYIGPYPGVDLLLSRLDPRRVDFRSVQARDVTARDNKELGWKGLVGVRMSPHFAFEAGYMDFGDLGTRATTAANGPFQAQTKAFTAFGVGFVPVGPVSLFAKAGPSRTQATGRIDGSYFDYQQRKIGYGAGVQLAQRRLVVRTEYERFGNGAVGDLSAVSLGFRLSFHTR